jgi:UDP-GlcNAc:undecaprenyl-phosphate/decaprenyl-phosphate GlcNAc-1-phosphate transferase
MRLAILCLPVVSFVIAWLATFAMKRIAPRLNFVDKPGHRKIHYVPKPLGGGVAIFLGIALPLLAAILVPFVVGPTEPRLVAYWSGARQQLPLGLGLLLAMAGMHLLGLFDDRKAMGPFVKLVVQLGITTALVVAMELLARQTPSLRLRVLTALDSRLGIGPLPSIVLTVLWIGAITNAFNFLDNMDGLSAGIAAVCTTAFLITALSIGQLFVAGMLAMLLGALVGFLCFNFPPASIFMGDSGSLLIGFVLGVLTVRTTYLAPGTDIASGWYAVFAPVIVLALPLYDFIVVSIIRISRGKSPFVGDTNHFSHRLVARGMSRRTAVLCLYVITAATSIAAIILPHVGSTFGAMLIFAQTVLILCVVALLEQHPLPPQPPSPPEP